MDTGQKEGALVHQSLLNRLYWS